MYGFQKNIIGGAIIFIRTLEILPFLIFLCYKSLLYQQNDINNQDSLLPKKRGITDDEMEPVNSEWNQSLII